MAESEQRLDARATLDQLEEAIEHLRVAYEKYFSGVDRAPPVRLKDRVARQLRAAESLGFRSTALRFRLGSLRSRFVTYKHYWTRIESQLERGVSRRDVLRMRRGLGRTDSKRPDEELQEVHEQPAQVVVDLLGSTQSPSEAVPSKEKLRLVPPPPPIGGKPATSAPPPPPGASVRKRGRSSKSLTAPAAGLDPEQLRTVFKDLVRAKKAAGESTKGLTYAALVRKLSREAPKLQQKHKCKELKFEVSTEGGKVRIRSGPA